MEIRVAESTEKVRPKPNETLRPSDEQCILQLERRGRRPALFPGEDPLGCEDRLLNQMTFVPPHVKAMRDANRSPPILSIVLMTGLVCTHFCLLIFSLFKYKAVYSYKVYCPKLLMVYSP